VEEQGFLDSLKVQRKDRLHHFLAWMISLV
jgi:hypothetical protein